MSRIRLVKPTLFIDDRLADCSPLARLLFIGLPCLADCEGRIEDRPRRIKVELLPYDDVDIETLLGELVSKGFIIRYEVGGTRCVQIVDFQELQQPRQSEKKNGSKLPPLPGCPSLTPETPNPQSPHSNPHSAVRNPQSPPPSNPHSAVPNPQSPPPSNPQSAIRNPQSPPPSNPHSAIRNPQSPPPSNPHSAIRNPQSNIALEAALRDQARRFRHRLHCSA